MTAPGEQAARTDLLTSRGRVLSGSLYELAEQVAAAHGDAEINSGVLSWTWSDAAGIHHERVNWGDRAIESFDGIYRALPGETEG